MLFLFSKTKRLFLKTIKKRNKKLTFSKTINNPRLKNGWFHVKLDLSRHVIGTTFGGSETRFKFYKFGLRAGKKHVSESSLEKPEKLNSQNFLNCSYSSTLSANCNAWPF